MSVFDVVILHENGSWLAPFVRALKKAGVQRVGCVHVTDEWDVHATAVSWETVKIIINRVSPSHRKRGHFGAIEHTNELLDLVRARTAGRVIELGFGRAWELELSKWAQHNAAKLAGLPTLPTVRLDQSNVAKGSPSDSALRLLFGDARTAPSHLLFKPDLGGSGFGLAKVRNAFIEGTEDWIYEEVVEQVAHALSVALLPAVVQEYAVTSDGRAPSVFRYEFLGDKLMYVLRISPDAEKEDPFDNCPADSCQTSNGAGEAADKCQIADGTDAERFSIVASDEQSVPHPKLLAAMKRYTRFAGSFVCGIEVLETADGRAVVIDANSVNTNYNSAAEDRARIVDRPVDQMAATVVTHLARLESATQRLMAHTPSVRQTLLRMFPSELQNVA